MCPLAVVIAVGASVPVIGSGSVSASSCYLVRGKRARCGERVWVPLVVGAIGASFPVVLCL